MQRMTMYVTADQTLAKVRDYSNLQTQKAPTLTIGVETLLALRLFVDSKQTATMPPEQLANVAAWRWIMDSDFNGATAPLLAADNENIAVSTADGFTQISIPMPETHTEELAAWLGTTVSRSGLHGQLSGYDGDGALVFLLQIENFTVRNRLDDMGNPTTVDPAYLNEAQVRAIVAENVGGGDIDLTEIEGDISQLQSDLSDLSDDVSTIQTQLAGLEELLGGI